MDQDIYNSKDILNYLISIAQQDGIISTDESNFIAAMEKEIEKYNKELVKSLDDGKITINEKMNLMKSRKEILQKAISVVREDLKITAEEQNLLDGLDIKIKELDDFEKEFVGL